MKRFFYLMLMFVMVGIHSFAGAADGIISQLDGYPFHANGYWWYVASHWTTYPNGRREQDYGRLYTYTPPGEVKAKIYGHVTLPSHATPPSKPSTNGSPYYPCTIMQISGDCFEKEEGMTSVTIPDTIETIGNCAFRKTGLTSVYIPDSVMEIGYEAFSGCHSLKEVRLPKGQGGDSDDHYGIGSFKECTSLQTLVIPEGWRYIPGGMCVGCTSLTSVSIPETVTEIKAVASGGAFEDCISLTEIKLPSKLASIAYSAFNGCINLRKVNVPKGLTTTEVMGSIFANTAATLTEVSVDEGATALNSRFFTDCTSLTKLTLPEGIKTIGDYCFGRYNGGGCQSLAELKLPSTVASIGRNAFDGCVSLQSIVIPESVTECGVYTFTDCKSLVSVQLPSSWTTLPGYMFDGCTSLASISIPEGVTEIGDYAFRGCEALTEIKLPTGLQSVGSATFLMCTGLKKANVPSAVMPTALFRMYPKTLEEVVIEEGVTTLPDNFFSGYTKLKKIVLPASLQSIGESCFSGCTSLEEIELPEGLVAIGDFAFMGCSSLQSIQLSETLTECGEYVFRDCTSLTSVKLPSTWETIQAGLFYNCIALPSITLPETLKCIDTHAFLGCTALTEIKLPAGLEEIGRGAFAKSAIQKVNIPKALASSTMRTLFSDNSITTYANIREVTLDLGIESLAKEFFSGCTALCSVAFSETVTSLGYRCFYNCTSLTEVTLPNGMKSLGDRTFEKCISLKMVQFPETIETLGQYLFSGCTSLTSVVLPNSLTTFGTGLFDQCSNLQKVQLPANLQIIPPSAFQKCTALQNIVIPETCTTIGSYALRDCTALERVTFNGNPPTSVGSSAFPATVGVYTVEHADEWEAVLDKEGKWKNLTMKAPPRVPVVSSIAAALVDITVSWEDSKGATHYDLYRGTTPIRPTTAYKTNVTSSFVDSNVTVGTMYYYWIAAVNDIGTSYSAVANACCEAVLTVSVSEFSVKEAGQTGIISIQSNDVWTASSSSAWITVSPTSSSGNGELSYVIAANTLTMPRSGTITVAGATGIVRTITVTQTAKTEEEPEDDDTQKPDLDFAVFSDWEHGNSLFMTAHSEDESIDVIRSVMIGEAFDFVFGVGNFGTVASSSTAKFRATITSEATNASVWSYEWEDDVTLEAMQGFSVRLNNEKWKDFTAGIYQMTVEIDIEDVIEEDDEDNSRSFNFEIVDSLSIAEGLGCLALTIDETIGWHSTYDANSPNAPVVRTQYLGNDSTNTLKASIAQAGELSFDWQVSSEEGYDILAFLVDGEVVTKISGSGVDWQTVKVFVEAGSHTFEWRYIKDESYYDGYDCAWVRNVTWTPAALAPVTDDEIRKVFTYTIDRKRTNVTITGLTPTASTFVGDIVIPERIEGVLVTSIAKNAIMNAALTGVAIPESVTTIGANAFSNCRALNPNSVRLPASIKKVDKGAFIGCAATVYPFVPGEKRDYAGYEGYKASFISSGLKLNSKTGVLDASFTKPGIYEGVFILAGSTVKAVRFEVSAIPTVTLTMEGGDDKCKVKGAGTYLVGKKVTLSATVPKHAEFLGWFEGETNISAAQKYSFVMEPTSREIVARFKTENVIFNPQNLLDAELIVGATVSYPLEITTESGIKSVSAKKLPMGLKVAKEKTTGRWILSGIPKKVGVSTATITVVSTRGTTRSWEVVLDVRAEQLEVSCALGELKLHTNSTINESIGVTLFDAHSKVKSISASKLPSGVKLVKTKDGNWILSGTPKKAGSYTIVLKVTTAAGTVMTLEIPLTVTLLPEWCEGSYYSSDVESYILNYGLLEMTGEGLFNIAADGTLLGTLILGNGARRAEIASTAKIILYRECTEEVDGFTEDQIFLQAKVKWYDSRGKSLGTWNTEMLLATDGDTKVLIFEDYNKEWQVYGYFEEY